MYACMHVCIHVCIHAGICTYLYIYTLYIQVVRVCTMPVYNKLGNLYHLKLFASCLGGENKTHEKFYINHEQLVYACTLV